MACSEFLYLQRQRGRNHTIAASFHMRLSGSSEQTGDPAVFVHVDLLGSGDLGQTRHGHDLAVRATMKPAPALTFRLRTVTAKSLGAPNRVGSSDREY